MKLYAKKYLKEIEWSMGNGQCPECCGHPDSWLGHPLFLTGEKLGHKHSCKLALALKELGESPLMIGDCKSDKEYECYIDDTGLFGTRLKTADGCHKYKAYMEKIRIEFDNALLGALLEK